MDVGSSRAVLQQEEQRWAVTNAPPQQAQPWAQPAPVPFHAYPAQQAAAGTAGAAEWEPAAYVSTNAGPPVSCCWLRNCLLHASMLVALQRLPVVFKPHACIHKHIAHTGFWI